MRIQRLSTSSFKLFTSQGKVVMIDPWLTNDPLWPLSERAPERLREIDVVVVTHAHFDHASGIEEIAEHNKDVTVIAQYEFALWLTAKGIKNVMPISFGATVEIKNLRFSPVPAAHTSSLLDSTGTTCIVGTAAGFVIETEDGRRIYASGDTGLTADMKFVVGDYYRPEIAILPATGYVVMEPEQAAYAANVTGCRYAIPFHDFPKELTDAADPEAYARFLEHDPFGVQDSYRKIEIFMETLRRDYPHVKGVYIPIGKTVEI
jgi:L-ascorbate metabolism protein UlaG (beta-lactamase superfamily)